MATASGSLPIVDVDQHRFEPPGMWREHIDPGAREAALSIDTDELGYAWLTWRGEQLYLAESQQPARPDRIAEHRARLARREPAGDPYGDPLPPSFSDASARLADLDAWGLDAAVLFPNFGLLWERT